jgi:two-component system, OmpR family, response regulator
VNDHFAALCDKKRPWFAGKNLFEEFPDVSSDWQEVVRNVADTRETYIDRTFRGLPYLPDQKSGYVWNVLVFPLKLHDNSNGVVISARVIEKRSS